MKCWDGVLNLSCSLHEDTELEEVQVFFMEQSSLLSPADMQTSQKCFMKPEPAAQESYKLSTKCLHLPFKLQGMKSYLEPKIELWSI